jgi:outer membrane protein assembly factor BamD (BamD/ComL family)
MRAILAVLMILTLAAGGCAGDGAQEVFETAQFEERQNNPAHAKELYQEILTRYPQSAYAKKAEERLRALDKKK